MGGQLGMMISASFDPSLSERKEGEQHLACYVWLCAPRYFKGITLPYPSRHPMNSTVFIFEMIKLRSSKEYAQAQKLSN